MLDKQYVEVPLLSKAVNRLRSSFTPDPNSVTTLTIWYPLASAYLVNPDFWDSNAVLFSELDSRAYIAQRIFSERGDSPACCSTQLTGMYRRPDGSLMHGISPRMPVGVGSTDLGSGPWQHR